MLVVCPLCAKPTLNNFKPFCSKRCQLLDLGQWLNGSYAIPLNDSHEYDEDEIVKNTTSNLSFITEL